MKDCGLLGIVSTIPQDCVGVIGVLQLWPDIDRNAVVVKFIFSDCGYHGELGSI